MKKILALVFALQFCLIAGSAIAAGTGKQPFEIKQAQPTKEGVLELDTQLNAKVSGKVSVLDTFTVQGEKKLQ